MPIGGFAPVTPPKHWTLGVPIKKLRSGINYSEQGDNKCHSKKAKAAIPVDDLR